MFPMVATVDEFRAAKALLLAEAKRVRPSPERLHIGTMLEIPALMWQLTELLKEVDFISVGSNDLLQFLFAADRGTPSLYDRYDFLSQPVLQLIEQLVVAASNQHVPISVCGEARVSAAGSAGSRGPRDHDTFDAGQRSSADQGHVRAGGPEIIPVGAERNSARRRLRPA